MIRQLSSVLLAIATLLPFKTSGQPLVTDADFDALLGDFGLPPNYAALTAPRVSADPIVGGPPLPARFSWKAKGISTPVRNQQRCAACWAFANIAVMELNMQRLYNDRQDLSEQQLITCVDWMQGCVGGSMSSFNYWQDERPQPESCNPFTGSDDASVDCAKCKPKTLPYRVLSYETSPAWDVSRTKALIMERGPGYFAFLVYRPFYDYWRGYNGTVYVQPQNAGPVRGGHAVPVIGWDDSKNAWFLQNSWGMSPSGPNKDGTFYLSYDDYSTMNYGIAFIDLERIGSPTTPAPKSSSTTSSTTTRSTTRRTTTSSTTRSTTTTTTTSSTTRPDGGSELGDSPVKCSGHTDCYVVREPKYLHLESKKGNVRWLSGCYCGDSQYCKMDIELNGRKTSSPCIYCGLECDNTNAFFAKV